MRRGWNTKSDLIDVFASFLLLSYGKLPYQTLILTSCTGIDSIDRLGNSTIEYAAYTDRSVSCGLPEITIPIVLISLALSVLFLFLYPFKAFRVLLSKFGSHSFQITLNIFVESSTVATGMVLMVEGT